MFKIINTERLARLEESQAQIDKLLSDQEPRAWKLLFSGRSRAEIAALLIEEGAESYFAIEALAEVFKIQPGPNLPRRVVNDLQWARLTNQGFQTTLDRHKAALHYGETRRLREVEALEIERDALLEEVAKLRKKPKRKPRKQCSKV